MSVAIYIKPAGPNLNGKVERPHLTDKLEFYQLLDHTDCVDLKEKLVAWKELNNVHRSHGGLGGRSPLEELRERWHHERSSSDVGNRKTPQTAPEDPT